MIWKRFLGQYLAYSRRSINGMTCPTWPLLSQIKNTSGIHKHLFTRNFFHFYVSMYIYISYTNLLIFKVYAPTFYEDDISEGNWTVSIKI